MHWRTVTVHHASAAVADALSTALSIASAEEILGLLPRLHGVTIWTVDRNGRDRRWSSGPGDDIAG
jgi:thiamine biosynthesis lipoprotein